MNVPEKLLYSQEHEWISVDGEIATLGITDHAQDELGDVVYVELPPAGTNVQAGGAFGSVESVKAVSEIYTPVDGEIIEVNGALEASPEKVNEDPYQDGWMVRIRLSDTAQLEAMLSAEGYRSFLAEEGG